jgi:hypothetical protein
MQPIFYRRHHFPPEIIRHAVWLYLRFTLSYGDVEELLAERGSTFPMRLFGDGFSSSGRLSPATCGGCNRDPQISGTWTK